MWGEQGMWPDFSKLFRCGFGAVVSGPEVANGGTEKELFFP